MGSLIINAFTLPFINAVGGSTQQRSWIIVSVIYGVAAAVLFLACFAMTKERVQISSQQKENIPLGESFRLVIQNNYWLIIVGIWVFTALGMGMGMGMSVGTYYAKYILGDENLSGFLSAIENLYLLAPLVFLIAMPILYWFYKLDKIYPQVMKDLEEREQSGKL